MFMMNMALRKLEDSEMVVCSGCLQWFYGRHLMPIRLSTGERFKYVVCLLPCPLLRVS
jgi:hypothetical protein